MDEHQFAVLRSPFMRQLAPGVRVRPSRSSSRTPVANCYPLPHRQRNPMSRGWGAGWRDKWPGSSRWAGFLDSASPLGSLTGMAGSASELDRPLARKQTNYAVTFAVLATAALAFSLLQSLIIPAIPQLEQTLHTSESSASWLLTAYLLSAAIATPILGR